MENERKKKKNLAGVFPSTFAAFSERYRTAINTLLHVTFAIPLLTFCMHAWKRLWPADT